jgi:hypothetical protein
MYQDSYREDNVYSKYRGLNLNNCLIAGLGELELIPAWLKATYPNCRIDVIEIDETKKSNLDINVIYTSIFTFDTQQKYDLIIMDIWYAGTPGYRNEIEVLKSKYYHYLCEGGIMSFPMIDMHTIYSYVELQRKYS